MHAKGAPRDPIVPITGKVAYLFLEQPSGTERLNKNRNPRGLKKKKKQGFRKVYPKITN